MENRHPLWFIALIPPEEIAREVTAFKKLAASRYHSKKALTSPAHITLQPPFAWPENRLGELTGALEALAVTCIPFEQELRGFDCFRPRVVFVNIVLNENLQDLAARIKSLLTPLLDPGQIDNRPYHPHMTVAYKDLEPRQFFRAWEFFSQQPFHRKFTANALFLLRHDSGIWNPVREFRFGGG